MTDPLDALANCKADCQSDLAIAKDNCRIAYPGGGQALDSCIDQAQVEAFKCRDVCREDVASDINSMPGWLSRPVSRLVRRQWHHNLNTNRNCQRSLGREYSSSN